MQHRNVPSLDDRKVTQTLLVTVSRDSSCSLLTLLITTGPCNSPQICLSFFTLHKQNRLLDSQHMAWVPSPALQKKKVTAHTCNSSIWGVEAGGSEVRSYPPFHKKLEASLGFRSPYLKNSFSPQTKIGLCITFTNLFFGESQNHATEKQPQSFGDGSVPLTNWLSQHTADCSHEL